jgi:hypothetical protein
MDEQEQDNNFKIEQLLLLSTDVCSALWSTDVSQKVVTRQVDSELMQWTYIWAKPNLSLNINAI